MSVWLSLCPVPLGVFQKSVLKKSLCSGSVFPLPQTGKVDFGTGTGRKAFFEFVFRPGSGRPPVHILVQRKKANSLAGTGHFSRCVAFLKRGGDWYWYTFRRVVCWFAGSHVDHPCGGQISPWPARKVTDKTGPGQFFHSLTKKRLKLSKTVPGSGFGSLGHAACHEHLTCSACSLLACGCIFQEALKGDILKGDI